MAGKRILWHHSPHSNDFVVGGGNEIRLYKAERGASSSESNGSDVAFSSRAGCSDIGQIRAFDWAPWSQYPDLIAVGQTTGRTVVLRIGAAAGQHSSDPSTSAPVTSFQINPRLSRPVNAVAFAKHQSWLTVGLDKARGESLLTYDIERSCSTLVKPTTGNRPQLNVRTSSEDSRPTEPILLTSLGASEGVSSATYLSTDAPLLAAGMGSKWLRVFDLRMSAPATVTAWGSRSPNLLAANPFDWHQIASASDDGIIRLWDLRKPMDALLSFSELDAASIRERSRSTSSVKPIQQLAWSPTERGTLSSSDRDSAAIRTWTILRGVTSTSGSEALPLPVLLDDQLSRPASSSLVTYAFAPSLSKSAAEHAFVGITRDSTSTALSATRFEVIKVDRLASSVLTERSVVISTAADSIIEHSIESTLQSDGAIDSSELSRTGNDRRPAGHGAALDRGRSISIGSVYVNVDRNTTPRPGARLSPTSKNAQLPTIPDSVAMKAALGVGGLAALQHDPSHVIRHRVEQGYRTNAANNAKIVESHLRDFWLCISRFEVFNKEAVVNDFDFRWRGVMSLISSFAPQTENQQPKRKKLNETSKSQTASIYNDISRTLRKGDEARQKDAAYVGAASALVTRLRLGSTYVVPGSQMVSQRQLALSLCGPQWQQEASQVCSELQRAGDLEAAARHALFNGQIENAMRFLQRCDDDKLRLLAPLLAAYLTQRNSNRGVDALFAEMCRTQSADNESPWIRSMFSFLASGGSWRELLDESGLSMCDRVAIALRFLSDQELVPYLQDLSAEGMSSCDLDSVLLFGLRDDGIKLLMRFLDRNADVQTVALAGSLVHPSIPLPPKQAEHIDRVLDAYRDILDRLGLHIARALFDTDHSRRCRQTLESSRTAGTHAKRLQDLQVAHRLPELQLRCTFCSEAIQSPAVQHQRAKANASTSVCPSCSKALPACSICLSAPTLGLYEVTTCLPALTESSIKLVDGSSGPTSTRTPLARVELRLVGRSMVLYPYHVMEASTATNMCCEETGKPKSQFAVKLHQILENDVSEDLRWLDDDTFEITGHESRAKVVLQQSFNMKSTASFIRQASYYGFTRLSDRRKKAPVNASRGSPPPIVFRHPSGLFVRGQPDLAKSIPRSSKPQSGRSKKQSRQFILPGGPLSQGDNSSDSTSPRLNAISLERPRPNRTVSCPAGLPTFQSLPYLSSPLSQSPAENRSFVDWQSVLARPNHVSSYPSPYHQGYPVPHTAASSESSYYSPVEPEQRDWPRNPYLAPPQESHHIPLYSDPGYFMRHSHGYFDPISYGERVRDDSFFELPPIRLPSLSAASGRTFANWNPPHAQQDKDENRSTSSTHYTD